MPEGTTIDRQIIAMEHFELDALVAVSKENVRYTGGYIVASQALGTRTRFFATVTMRDGKTAMVLTENELLEATKRSTITDLRPYDEFSGDPLGILVGILADYGVSDGRIGIELDVFDAQRWDTLRTLHKSVRWEHATPAFEFARAIKTPEEIGLLRQAAKIAETAQIRAHSRITPGMTERDVYRIMNDAAIEAGADEVLMIQVGSGNRSTYSNPSPSDRKILPGEVVKIDMFVSKDGYLSDNGRSFVVGEASAEQRDTWRTMNEIIADIYAQMRPGADAGEIWRRFVDLFHSHNMQPAMKFLGHGLGLSLHEEPYIAGHSHSVLEEGMVMAVEPVYNVGDYGYHLEDNLAIGAEGPEIFTSEYGADIPQVGV